MAHVGFMEFPVETHPEIMPIFVKAFAGVEGQFNAAWQAGDSSRRRRSFVKAYLDAIPELVAAHQRNEAPAIAEMYRARIAAKSLVTPVAAPIPAEPPKAMKERTRVTKHSPDGRILEFVREQVEA